MAESFKDRNKKDSSTRITDAINTSCVQYFVAIRDTIKLIYLK